MYGGQLAPMECPDRELRACTEQLAGVFTIAKCFERLVLSHLKSCLHTTQDPHQFACCTNRSTEEALSALTLPALNAVQ